MTPHGITMALCKVSLLLQHHLAAPFQRAHGTPFLLSSLFFRWHLMSLSFFLAACYSDDTTASGVSPSVGLFGITTFTAPLPL